MTFKELFRKWGLNSIKLKVGFAEVENEQRLKEKGKYDFLED